MGFSYSKVDTFHTCAYQYKLRYVDKLEVLPDQRESCALYIGTAGHEGIEKRSVDEAVKSYISNYKELNRYNLREIEKIKAMVTLAINEIPEGEYEFKLLHPDGFIGFIDMLVKVDDSTYDLYDFKFSNNADGYKESGQVHIYKYYYELLTGNKIRNIYYAVVPKFKEDLNEQYSQEEFKTLVEDFYRDKHVNFLPIEFDRTKVNYFFARKAMMNKADASGEYPKKESWKCSWCDYRQYCQSNGADMSELSEKAKLKLKMPKEVSLF